jgi:hypothetical protein
MEKFVISDPGIKLKTNFVTSILIKTIYMKQIKYSVIALVAFLISVASFSQTVEEIVNKNIEATGGAEAWRKVTSIRTEGSMTVQGAEVAITITVLHGKGMKQEISVMGMTGFTIVTPAAGWNFMPFQGQSSPEAMTADELKEGQDDMDAQGILIDYAAKGTTVELLGKEDVEGTECFKLKATTKNGSVETMFIDPKSYLVVRTITKQKANGQETEVITDLANYQKTPEGILVPMSLTLPFGEAKISKVEVNLAVDEKIFSPK